MRTTLKLDRLYKFFPLTCLACSLFITHPSRAQTITLTSTIYPPFVYEQNGQLTGIDFDIVSEAAKRLDIELDLRLMPWQRVNRNLKLETKDLEAVVSFFKTRERTQYMDYTNVPVHVTEYRLFVRKNSPLEFNKLADFTNFYDTTIGVNSSFKTNLLFEQAVANKKIVVAKVKTDKQNFLKLASGRIDAVLTNFHVGSYTIKTLDLADQVTVLPQALSKTPAFLIFAKSAQLSHLVPLFNQSLTQMQQDGSYQKIYQKHGVYIDSHYLQ